MRTPSNRNLAGGIIVFVWAVFQLALAQPAQRVNTVSVGDLLTVTSRNAPENTKMVTYALGRQVRGLLMQPSGLRQWSGDFMIIPSQAGTTLRPVLTYYLDNGITMTQKLEPIDVKPGQPSEPGVISTSDSGRVVCVFDATVSASSVQAVTTDGSTFQVGHENNYFVLPAEVSADNLEEVTAQTVHGEELRLTPRG